jgi:restriction system protein
MPDVELIEQTEPLHRPGLGPITKGMLTAADPKPSSPELIGPVLHGLADALVTFWPLWLLIAAIGAAKLAWRIRGLRRLSRSGIAEVDLMDGTTFEHFLTTLFRRLGYSVEHTGRRGDYGADLVVTKEGRRVAVQAKRWTKAVGVKAVQEAVASKGMYRCAEALVVANRAFTRQARTLARANDVTLWDREMLVGKLLAVGNHATDAALAPTPESLKGTETTVPLTLTAADAQAYCTSCGVAVSQKVRNYCLERPERFAGRTYCFKHQRLAPMTIDTR